MDSACPCLVDCPMYGLFGVSPALDVWKARYCRCRYESCVRYQLARQGESVPPGLLPNGSYLAGPTPAGRVATRGAGSAGSA